jgi:hypothetical protein
MRRAPAGRIYQAGGTVADRLGLSQETCIRLECCEAPPFEGLKYSPDVPVSYRKRRRRQPAGLESADRL